MPNPNRTVPLLPLLTKDPVTGGELIVTELTGPESGLVIRGRFSLGWVGRLTPDQLAFAGLLVKYRGNLQRVAAELNIAYNTARNRMDDIAAALEAPPPSPEHAERAAILDRLASGAIPFEEAMRLLDR
ncbi:MAG TPA: DUF2089 domain-containing protein [Herpetosiphonaceae bacterium]|nr:DUF2089 domain-containing protein [Herpetosiphonaceae bacterium]